MQASSPSVLSHSTPSHVAFIMDGNGRWAKQQGLTRAAGHQAGVKAIEATIRVAREKGIAYLTYFGFSSENWRRPASEVRHLFDLFYQTLRDSLPKLQEQGIRLRFIGDLTALPSRLQKVINTAEKLHYENPLLTVTIALNYGGRWDILSAIQKTMTQPIDFSELEQNIESNLSTQDIPDPDLLIRTSGEHRISNFLLWQIAYTELYFTDTLWPDFHEAAFEKALEDYYKRQRRFGGLNEE